MSDFAVGDRVICFDDFGAVGDHGVIRWIESTGLAMIDFDDGQSWVTERHQLAREELTGRAGAGDDSIYSDDGRGPWCEYCFCKAYPDEYEVTDGD